MGGDGQFYLEKSYSTGNIESTGNDVGGLIGYGYICGTGSSTDGYGKLAIYNCFSTSSLNGKNNIGGLIGELNRDIGYRGKTDININNVYVSGKIQAQDIKGAIIGKYTETKQYNGSLSVSNSYWVLDTTEIDTSKYGIEKELSKMYNSSEFPKFDFENIWKIDEGTSMPYLKELDKPDSVNK